MNRKTLLITTVLTGTLLHSAAWAVPDDYSNKAALTNATDSANATRSTPSASMQPEGSQTSMSASSPTATSSNTATANAQTPATSNTADAKQLQNTASKIVGNINIATLALEQGMNDDATTHIDAARAAIASLNGQMTSYDSDTPITAGKMHYKTSQGESTYWIPVENDHFVVRTFNGKHLASKNPDVDVTDAQAVHFKMVLNTKMADQQLAKAQTDIGQKQYNAALTDMQNASNSAITETVVEELPLEAARDNLIVSRELLQDKDYRGASFALKHADKELSQVERQNPGSANNADMKKMQSQIHRLEASIAKEKPSIMKTAEMKIDGWIKDVKAKLHSA